MLHEFGCDQCEGSQPGNREGAEEVRCRWMAAQKGCVLTRGVHSLHCTAGRPEWFRYFCTVLVFEVVLMRKAEAATRLL